MTATTLQIKIAEITQPEPPIELQIQAIHAIEAFHDLQAEWDRLTAESGASIFLDHTWLSVWWQTYGSEYTMHVLLAHRLGVLVGALPLMLERGFMGIRRLQFIGSGEVEPNHLDILTDTRYRKEIISAFAHYLYQNRVHWDILEFNKLFPDEILANNLRLFFKPRHMLTEALVSSRCAYIQVPATVEAYLQTRSYNRRRNLRKERNRLLVKHPDIKFNIVTTLEQLEIVFPKLIELHQTRWEARGYPGAFATPQFRQFHQQIMRRLLATDQLKLFYLETAEQIIAVEYCILKGGILYDYLPGFDERWHKDSPGSNLTFWIIEQAIRQNWQEIDFLEGDEAYKEDWLTHQRDNLRLRVYASTWRGRLAGLKNMMSFKIKDWGVRFVPVAIRRPLWQIYLKWRIARQSRPNSVK